MTESNDIYFPEYRIYKPNTTNSGAASKIQVKIKPGKFRDVQIFWEASLQIKSKDENAAFAWTDAAKKVTMKLSEVDLGEILAVLNGQKDFAGPPGKDGKNMGLFHKNKTGNATLQFTKLKGQNSPLHTYYVRLAAKKADGKLIEVKHAISISESEILKVLLSNAVSLIFNWK